MAEKAGVKMPADKKKPAKKEKATEDKVQFGRSGIGKIDTGFVEFLDTIDLTGFDKERLKQEALKYLSEEGMLRAMPHKTANFCTACFNGKYPAEIPKKFCKRMLERRG